MRRNRPSFAHVAALEARRLFAAQPLADLSPLGAKPEQIATTRVDGPAFFSGRTGAAGRELWTTDATAAGTRMVVDLAPGRADASPTGLVAAGRLAYFAATVDGKAGLYRSDGTARGTTRLLSLANASDFASPVAVGGDAIAFQLPARDGSRALWRSDGSIRGTVAIVAGGLPTFRSSVANPATGELLAVSNRRENVLTYSDGTAAGTRRLDAKGDTFGSLASADGAIYFVAQHASTMTLHRLVSGKVATVAEDRAFAVFGEPGDPAIGVHFSSAEDGGLASYSGGVGTEYPRRDEDDGRERPLPFNREAQVAANEGEAIYIEPYAGVTSFWRADAATRTLRPAGEVEIVKIEGAVPTRDAVYAIGPESFDRVLVRVDASGGRRTLFTSDGYAVDADDADANGLMAATGGRMLFRGTSPAGVPELFALDPATDRVEQLTDVRGSTDDVTIVAQAHASGRSLILSWSYAAGTLALDLVDANVAPRRLLSAPVSNGGSSTLPWPDVDDASVTVAGSAAYVSFDSTTLLRVDLVAGTSTTIRGGGRLLGVDGTRAYFARGADLWTTTGKASTTRRVAALPTGTPKDVRSAAVASGRLVFATERGLFAADPSGVAKLADGGAPFADRYQTPIAAGAYAYARQGHRLVRTDGTAAGTAAVFSPATREELGESGPVVSADGAWIYATVLTQPFSGGPRADWPWRIMRFAADTAGRPQTVIAAPEGWSATYAYPHLLAASGNDVVFESSIDDDGPAPWGSFRVSPTGGAITRLRHGGADIDSPYGAATAYADGVLLTARDGQVVRVKDGIVRPLPGLLRSAGALGVADGSAWAEMSTPGNGRTLYRHRLDTVVSGYAFNDLDADRGKDAGERGLADWRVWIDADDDGRWDRNELYVRTDYLGRFEFFELDPGTHKLRIGTLADYESTTGYVFTVKPKAGERVTKRFGARPIR